MLFYPYLQEFSWVYVDRSLLWVSSTIILIVRSICLMWECCKNDIKSTVLVAQLLFTIIFPLLQFISSFKGWKNYKAHTFLRYNTYIKQGKGKCIYRNIHIHVYVCVCVRNHTLFWVSLNIVVALSDRVLKRERLYKENLIWCVMPWWVLFS